MLKLISSVEEYVINKLTSSSWGLRDCYTLHWKLFFPDLSIGTYLFLKTNPFTDPISSIHLFFIVKVKIHYLYG